MSVQEAWERVKEKGIGMIKFLVGKPGDRRHMCVKVLADKAAQTPSVIYRKYDRVEHEGFPQSTQLDGYSCGVQAVKMVLDYFFSRDTDEKRLNCRLRTDEDGGTEISDVVRVLRKSGLTASPHNGGRGTNDAIRRAIDQDKVVIAVVPARERGVGHLVCVYGYTTHPRKLLMIRDPVGWRTLRHKTYRVSEYIVVGQKTRPRRSRTPAKKRS